VQNRFTPNIPSHRCQHHHNLGVSQHPTNPPAVVEHHQFEIDYQFFPLRSFFIYSINPKYLLRFFYYADNGFSKFDLEYQQQLVCAAENGSSAEQRRKLTDQKKTEKI
jgi:hypothetical protein